MTANESRLQLMALRSLPCLLLGVWKSPGLRMISLNLAFSTALLILIAELPLPTDAPAPILNLPLGKQSTEVPG
jgi:hypothetical protein